MKYIASCEWENNEISFLLFGYTESHYIEDFIEPNTGIFYDVYMIHVWKSCMNWTHEYDFSNKRFDPGTRESKWSIEKKYIFDSFEEACSHFFKQLFRGK